MCTVQAVLNVFIHYEYIPQCLLENLKYVRIEKKRKNIDAPNNKTNENCYFSTIWLD